MDCWWTIIEDTTGFLRDHAGVTQYRAGRVEQNDVLLVAPRVGYSVRPIMSEHDPDGLTQKYANGALVGLTAEERRIVLIGRLRIERNTRLRDSDWTQIPDAALTADAKTAWRTYRQALRDLPATVADPAHPVWPVSPSA